MEIIVEGSTVYNGDCLEVMDTIEKCSVDSIVTDPPYHLTSIVQRFGKEDSAPAQFGTDGAFARASKGFMGKEWDGGDIAFQANTWRKCYELLKPGGHLIAFSGSRTYHRMAVAIEDAGFEIRDQCIWLYGSGFPKSHNIGKEVDKKMGNEREIVKTNNRIATSLGNDLNMDGGKANKDYKYTQGNSEWEGWGTALKPAHEPMVLARKPLSEKSVADNVMQHRTGAINIDACRVQCGPDDDIVRPDRTDKQAYNFFRGGNENVTNVRQSAGDPNMSEQEFNDRGRFPSNIMHNGDTVVENIFPDNSARYFYTAKTNQAERNFGLHGFETKQTQGGGGGIGNYQNDVNSASGKFGSEKAPSKNTHPTVKPVELMRYLVRLVTPKGGVVLDPFMGSGSTGMGAREEDFNFIGIEKEEEYYEIAKARIKNVKPQLKLFDI
jgi:site-specific DNA-methyltransferase (adenine-specific)